MNRHTHVPLISVITVCRNSAATIARTFESVLSQSYLPIEYIVIDGVSSDGTLDLIKAYEEKFRSRGIQFRWLSESDRGIYDAMNKGITQATGEIIGILNSDDYYEPDSTAVIAGANTAHPEAGIFYGFLRVLMGAGQELQCFRYRYENYLLNLRSGVFTGTQHPACFVRRRVYQQIGGFDTQFSVAADYDFLVRALKQEVCFQPVDKVLSNFTLGGASTTVNDYERLKERYGVMFKNGLLTESEYRGKQSELRYQKYKAFKQRLIRALFRL